ncbi:MAG TPA: hypothetical protein VHG91_04995 [Longimicrobium sp.]|nr:hypothetical protein [Longimicrobium sp.]
MSFDAARLYELLPAVYRVRDTQPDGAPGPLHALLEVIAGQAAVLEESLEQLLDDQFVETAAPWVLPYIGDLLGVEGLPPDPLTPRAEVANTLAWRRRKGTAHVLERIARDVTGLDARAVEFFELLATTQRLNHLRPQNRSWVSVRQARRLEDLGGPFERQEGETDLPHTADVRRIGGGHGRYNIPNVGIFLWRLQAYRLTRSPAVADPSDGARRFRFSPLGNDAPLFNLPITEDDPAGLAGPLNVPAPIRRRAMRARPADHYGRGRSLLVEARDGGGAVAEIAVADVSVCDLSTWRAPPAGKALAVDPVLGRMSFADAQPLPPLATFHHGFAPVLAPGQAGVVEVADGMRYAEALSIAAGARRVTLRAADGVRPTLVLAAPLEVSGQPEGSVVLDGLLIAGAPVRVASGAGQGLGTLRVRHCTLVPGLALGPDGTPAAPEEPSLVVEDAGTRVTVEHSITGGVRAPLDAHVRIADSVLDACGVDGVAFAAPGPAASEARFGATLVVEDATVFGKVKADALELVSNTILLAAVAPGDDPAAWPGPVVARRRQTGCARFSYVPPGSRTPRRFQCQPPRESEDAAVRPVPLSRRYGDPWYALLPARAPSEIRRGADDESEMGVFHDLHLPRREAHLRSRLDEYLRFGLEAGLFHAT